MYIFLKEYPDKINIKHDLNGDSKHINKILYNLRMILCVFYIINMKDVIKQVLSTFIFWSVEVGCLLGITISYSKMNIKDKSNVCLIWCIRAHCLLLIFFELECKLKCSTNINTEWMSTEAKAKSDKTIEIWSKWSEQIISRTTQECCFKVSLFKKEEENTRTRSIHKSKEIWCQSYVHLYVLILFCTASMITAMVLKSTFKEDRMRQPAFSTCKMKTNQRIKKRNFDKKFKLKYQWVKKKRGSKRNTDTAKL